MQPAECLSYIDSQQQQQEVGSSQWWELEAVQLTWLFDFQQNDELYAELRPWLNNQDVPEQHQPLISMLYGKWLARNARNEEAKEALTQALNGFEALYDKQHSQQTALLILNLMVELNRFERAEKFVKGLVEKQYKDEAFYREVYAELGHIAYLNKENTKHIKYRLESLHWALKTPDDQQKAVAYNNYAIALRMNGEYKKAREAFLAGLDVATQAGDEVRVNTIRLKLAELALIQNNLDKAHFWLRKVEVDHLPSTAFGEYRKLSVNMRDRIVKERESR
ncbi:hypothetical protein D210916BOD24_13120 [Alteromonas sp. D210916BOD_24]|uniref:tetratricopeptide repeat protein n=1 Tax=Alteromonas sp. D210916BOD_24 TaxID=3157618 RepID=UPI00399C8141